MMAANGLETSDIAGTASALEGARWAGPAAWRFALVCTCLFAAGCGLAPGNLQETWADPGLTALLKGMAMLKAAIAAMGAGLVWWRLGLEISPKLASAYIACIAAASAGTALVWTLSHIGVSALLFHGALIAFLVLGLKDALVKKVGRAAC